VITLNSKIFADNKKSFNPEVQTGYCKPLKRHIKLFNANNEFIGAITCHKVLALATRQDSGAYWFSYGDIKEIGKYDKYSRQSEDINNALRYFNVNT